MATRMLRLARGPDGRLLTRRDRSLLAHLLGEEQRVEPIRIVDRDFPKKRLWTTGPGGEQTRISLPGHLSAKLKPQADGSYIIESAEVDAVAKAALHNRYFPDDIPEGEPSAKCEACGWTCRSYRAMNYH